VSRPLSLALAAVVAWRVHDRAQHRKIVKAVAAALGGYGVLRALLSLSRSCFGLEREATPQELWAAQREEEAVEPELRIFDPHHHMWDFQKHDKPDMQGLFMKLVLRLKPAVLNDLFVNSSAQGTTFRLVFGKRIPFVGNYMGQHLLRDIRGRAAGGHNVIGSMYMECGWHTHGREPGFEPAGEVDMVEAEHAKHPSICQAMVAGVDLCLGKKVEPVLKWYASKKPFVKGVRHALWHPLKDERLRVVKHVGQKTASSASFREGFALLREHGLTFDTWLCHENLEELEGLARDFPHQRIICDHLGFPLGTGLYSLEESTLEWKASIAALAKHKNVYMKLGGLGMPHLGHAWEERPLPPSSDELAVAWGPYVLYCIESFGVARCMMESNFPMDKITCSYTILFNALKKIVKDYSKEDKVKLFETTALECYGVELPRRHEQL